VTSSFSYFPYLNNLSKDAFDCAKCELSALMQSLNVNEAYASDCLLPFLRNKIKDEAYRLKAITLAPIYLMRITINIFHIFHILIS
jgi:hypothetical protein